MLCREYTWQGGEGRRERRGEGGGERGERGRREGEERRGGERGERGRREGEERRGGERGMYKPAPMEVVQRVFPFSVSP